MSDTRLVLTHNNDDLSIDEAVLVYNDVKEGFTVTLPDIGIKSADSESFMQNLNDISEYVEYDYSKNKNNVHFKLHSEKYKCYARGNSVDIYWSVVTKDEETCNKIWKLYLDYSKTESGVDVFAHSFFMNNGQVDNTSSIMDVESFDYISESYYPYIDIDIMFDQFYTGSENILLLVGEPGLGKSKMSTLAIKHAQQNPDKLPYDKLSLNPALDNQYVSVVTVKSTDVLVNDRFWRELSQLGPDICIIDDLDYMLTKRDSEVMSVDDAKKNDFLNFFLSFTDGVEKNRTKFIITTNQSYDEVDTALLRKGRLFDILELRPLALEEAEVIWDENDIKDDFYSVFKSDEVLPADLGSEINKRLNTRITTATLSYLKEEGISKVKKASRNRKIKL